MSSASNEAAATPLRSFVYPPAAEGQVQQQVQVHGKGSSPHLNASVVVIVVILSVVFILSGFLHLLARCLGRRHRTPPPRHHSPLVSALHGQLQHLFHLHDAGVEQAFIDTLPVFSYGSIRGLKDSADCAVCLTEFGDDDRLRLLPKCKHAFHIECIDTWLLSNSTCPLCRRSLLPDPGMHSGTREEIGGSTSDMMHSNRFICLEQQQPRVVASLHGSIHGSYQNSFRICDVDEPESENEIQEIEEDDDHAIVPAVMETPSPFAPTIRVMDQNGSPKILKVILGRVAPGATDSRKLTSRGARCYSMGSYEYIVDPASWELMMAPTPYPGRPQQLLMLDWASSGSPKNLGTHRSALSDGIPEVAADGNDELFWASRGLYTPHTLSRVRELLTPIGSEYSGAAFSPAPFTPGVRGDRWIDIDIEQHQHQHQQGEIVEDDSDEDSKRWMESSSPSPSQKTSTAEVGDAEIVPKQRCSSLSRLPEGKVSVSWYRRSLSAGEVSAAAKDSSAANAKEEPGKSSVNKQGSSFSRRFSLNWLMGRDKRVVFSATSPESPEQTTTATIV